MSDSRIQDWCCKKISNIDYEMMTVGEKQQLIKDYKMISFNEPEFEGYWMLIER